MQFQGTSVTLILTLLIQNTSVAVSGFQPQLVDSNSVTVSVSSHLIETL